ncbi:complement factor I-like [Sardina pilchardus]|uniref:complement factor I-like n=1 Tax=Sardina pilchardus TaxID=27697 RepID=UPI002E12615A
MSIRTRMKPQIEAIPLLLLLIQNAHLLPSDHSAAGAVRSKPEEATISGSHSQTHTDRYLGPEDCLKQQYTQLSCAKVSCPLGHRCSEGDAMCTCDPKPDECYSKEKVCTRNGKEYNTRCHAVAETCKDINKAPVFSHQGTNCSSDNTFEDILTVKDVIEVQLPKDSTKALVCQQGWNIAAAHVACHETSRRLAKTATNMKYSDVPRQNINLPDVCVPIFCKGHEYSLAECQIGSPVKLNDKSHIAVADCYSVRDNPSPGKKCDKGMFQCANGKCVQHKKTCDGINNCGDGSDEMCCKECRNDKAFHCKSNVCIAQRARNDGVPDCLDGDDEDSKATVEPRPSQAPVPEPTTPPAPAPTTPQAPTSTTPVPTTKPILTDDYLGPEGCLKHKFIQPSCVKAFCPPWMRCVDDVCVCKLPYMCLRLGPPACGHDGRRYLTHCQAMASSCRMNRKVFSHFGSQCSVTNVFSTFVKTDKEVIEVKLPNISRNALVCAEDWNMAAANVVCRDQSSGKAGGAGSVMFSEVQREDPGLPGVCVRVQCTGHEYSLAECNIYGDMRPLTSTDSVATVHCATEDADDRPAECEFSCANSQCVKLNDTCDGVNHCGDGSDEMCCKACRRGAFHCQSNVCIPPHAIGDGIRDCLGGDDEAVEKTDFLPRKDPPPKPVVISDPKQEIKRQRASLEVLQCGVPNMDYVPPVTDYGRGSRRRKRVVGGQETTPTQIQWQVAIQEDGKVNCGGAYLGGCWVLTAAHCVRAKPESFRVMFSLWMKRSIIDTTDIAFVKKVHIHYGYNAKTYENDIALLELKVLGGSDQCLHENPAIRAVCVPWSIQQFQPGHNCTISGWGRDREGVAQNKLLWASVALIENCHAHYPGRFRPGMMCAGDVEGSVDSCQGDSGGPLVCQDPSGMSYVWGVVSWGEKCGQKGYPGVYNQVAHYYDWIRVTTEKYITKYNN